MALFGLGRKPTTFGLDIGTSAIKAIELAQTKSGLALKSFASVPLPRDVIAEGTIREPQVVTDAIKECVEKAGITGVNAVISVSGREAIVKRVPLPKVTPKELGDAIQLEAEHHIPFAIDVTARVTSSIDLGLEGGWAGLLGPQYDARHATIMAAAGWHD